MSECTGRSREEGDVILLADFKIENGLRIG
jgi:hypothetical protein